MRSHRRAVCVALIALMATGCTKAVEIPRADIDDAKYREPGSYRIRLHGRQEYLVRRFSVTDSTVVVEELMPGDERFRTGREWLPTSILWGEVESISRTETNWLLTVVALTPIVFVAVVIGWFILDDGGGFEGTEY